MAPPVTPSPHRFLNKSISNSTRGTIPPSQSQPPQEPNFSSTPRFAFHSPLHLSSSSTLRHNDPSTRRTQYPVDASPLLHPPTISAHPTAGGILENGDIFATPSSPASPPLLPTTQLRRRHDLIEDAIELPSSSPGQSEGDIVSPQPSSSPPAQLVPRSPGLETPRAKRRRSSDLCLPNSPTALHAPDKNYAYSEANQASQSSISLPPSPPLGQNSSRFVIPSLAPAPTSPLPASHAPVADAKSQRSTFLRPQLPNVGARGNQRGEEGQSPLNHPISPQQKLNRYMSGGLAATVRDWIVEASGSTGLQGRQENVRSEAISGTKEAGVPTEYHAPSSTSNTTAMHCATKAPRQLNLRIHVSEVMRTSSGHTAGNAILLRGHITDSLDVDNHLSEAQGPSSLHVLLPSAPRVKQVHKGKVLDMKAPLWEIEACGIIWIVAMNWVVLPT
ncbi:hypothetical protein L228DRAFT_286277 [Xylona heveae TC161]|uniref:Uncharacterized protein n=1 Tax=Xylona heveae (strain CBS 132557 / TC161) TaxID=1328760 RepID=A0A164ZFT0_XYLHT|nr:hypothetical protein L228DRAFT_286277 [Xylona heveae TC161]KZF19048.1 hypothetical protein L228DRAFT_286277 [Xylona heveae TC161]